MFRASTRLLQGVTDDEPSVGLFDAHLLTGTSPLEVRVSAEDVRPRRDSARQTEGGTDAIVAYFDRTPDYVIDEETYELQLTAHIEQWSG